MVLAAQKFVFVFALIMIEFTSPTYADEIAWPKMASGEKIILTELAQVPTQLRDAARLSMVSGTAVEFTFFKAPKGRDYVIVTPCCGSDQNHAALFEFSDGVVQPVGLPVGDPRLGFTTQISPDEITLGPDAQSIRTHVSKLTCEEGDWRYYYSFDEADRLYLRSAIDTSCEHLGTRELYRAHKVDVGKWWMH
jgi:hypothetical protein